MASLTTLTRIEIPNVAIANHTKQMEIMLVAEKLHYDIAKRKDNYDVARICIGEVDGFLSLASAHNAEIIKHRAMYC